jgi:hypothetical protein
MDIEYENNNKSRNRNQKICNAINQRRTSIGKERSRGAARAVRGLWLATAFFTESMAARDRRVGVAVAIGAENSWRGRTECRCSAAAVAG